MKPLSEMEVTHVVDLAIQHMHIYTVSDIPAVYIRRKENLHMIYLTHREFYTCVYITEHDCLPLYIMHMHHIPAAWIRTLTVCHILDAYINYLTCGSPSPSISSTIYTCMQHQIPAAWIGTVSLHGSCHNPKFTLGFLYTQGGCLTTLHGLTRKQSYNNEEEVAVSLRETEG